MVNAALVICDSSGEALPGWVVARRAMAARLAWLGHVALRIGTQRLTATRRCTDRSKNGVPVRTTSVHSHAGVDAEERIRPALFLAAIAVAVVRLRVEIGLGHPHSRQIV